MAVETVNRQATIDAYDGTPVLDIKPYLPSIDGVKSIKNESLEKEPGLQ